MNESPTCDEVDPEVARIQAYLRESARANYEVLALPPFRLFFQPADPLKYYNYAIPDQPTGGDLTAVLAELRRVFHERGRVARFEFFEAFAPRLPEALRAAGFEEEERQWSMLCTPATLRELEPVPGLEMVEVTAESPEEDLAGFLWVQREGFASGEAAPEAVTPGAVQQARRDLARGLWRCLLGRLEGQPAGCATFARPLAGVSEIAGVATRPAYRRRGVAGLLSAQAARAAFAAGAATACLTAADAGAGRVYERAGFRPFSVMLAYSDAPG